MKSEPLIIEPLIIKAFRYAKAHGLKELLSTILIWKLRAARRRYILTVHKHKILASLLRPIQRFRIPNMQRFTCIKPPVLIGISARSALRFIREQFPDSMKETISDADQICSHVFDLLGSGKVKLGRSIPWHTDFKSGFSWDPDDYYLWTDKYVSVYMDQKISADVKVPWELSRFQHLPTLGKAYWYTGESQYADEIISEITDWIDKNPAPIGVNWACTMDVAIRAVNWIWAYGFIYDTTIKQEQKEILLSSLFRHGIHIRNNLEGGPVRGNHYLSDIAGLIYLGLFFRSDKRGKEWLEFGINELINEMEFQVREDGVDGEGSIGYHRLVTEIFLSCTIIAKQAGISFPKLYLNRLERMIEYVIYYSKPDGTTPQINDTDDGRLHILSHYGNWNKSDHRYLCAIGAVLFERSDMWQAAGQFTEEAYWLCGEDSLQFFSDLKEPVELTCPSSKAFPDGGIFILRHRDKYLIADCIQPKDPTGHLHNSRLSFELYAGKSFIIDPGTWVYTADPCDRNMMRSTEYHNTIQIDGVEQAPIPKASLFNLGKEATVKVKRWESNENQDLLVAEHYGYSRLINPVIHQRCFIFRKKEGYFILVDHLKGRGMHRIDLSFHLAVPVEPDREALGVFRTIGEGPTLTIIPVYPDTIKPEITTGFISPSYGIRTEAPIIRYSGIAKLPARLITILDPTNEYFKIDIQSIITHINYILEDQES